MRLFAVIFFIFTLLIQPGNTLASDAPLAQALSQLNRIKPLQNPKFQKSKSALGRSVLDRSNKIIGKIEDLIVSEEGQVLGLVVVFDRLQMTQGVFVGYDITKITPSSNGYRLGLESKDITALYPDLLAGIETAAGNMSAISISKSIGLDVVDENLNKIGQITDVLLDQQRTQLLAFHVVVNEKRVRKEGVAVPFSAIRFASDRGVLKGHMTNTDVDKILRYLEK